MDLLVCFINKRNLVDSIMSMLIQQGVGGVTVLASSGIGRSKAEEAILFGGFKDYLRGESSGHVTLLCLVSKFQKKKINLQMRKIFKNFKEKSQGLYFYLPNAEVYGLKK